MKRQDGLTGTEVVRDCSSITPYSDYTRSFRCLDCEHVRHAKTAEIQADRNFRCLRCGGPLDETDDSFFVVTGVRKSEAAAVLHKKVGTIFPYTCPCCGEPFRSKVGFQMHIEESHNLIEEELTDEQREVAGLALKI